MEFVRQTDLWPVIALSLLLLHIVLLRIVVGPILTLTFQKTCEDPVAKPIFGYLQNEVGAGTFKPSSPIILKPAPKRLRTFLSRNQPLPSAGTLPAWSKLNDLVRLRAAIIASCIFGARKELS